jgi:hypothetical protein
MRSFITYLPIVVLAACHGPQTTDGRSEESTRPRPALSDPQVPLIFNTDSKVPILTAFGNGTLKVAEGCLVFDTGSALFTPVWPRATRWDGTKREIVTPAGGRFVLGKAVVLPGGPMGSVAGSDLKPDTAPDKSCPPDFFGVHPN